GDHADVAARVHAELGKGRVEGGGKVVDAEVAEVLEALDGEAPPRPRHAGDDHEAKGGSAAGRLRAGRAHRFLGASRRRWEGRIPSSSRYLATVRRAMVSPCPLSTRATSWSDSGLDTSSAATMSRIFFLMDTEETISPVSEAMPLWKKYLSSKSPCGVSTYLLVVTRLMVDSCMPMSSPTSRRASGRRKATPLSRKSRWNLTRLCVTLRRVRCRCSTLLMSHTAERSFCSTYCLASSLERRRSER